MKLLVTGCRGFIGASVGIYAAERKHEVLGIGRSSQPLENWSGKYIQADIATTDLAPVIRFFSPDAILHGAGAASVSNSYSSPVQDFRAAAITFLNLLDSIERSTVRPVILFPSSAALYGNPSRLPIDEDSPSNPISPYGFHKLICETIADEYAKLFDLNIVCCRLFSVFGPLQRRLLVWELFHQLKNPGEELHLQGTGNETRDYLPIDEVSRLFLEISVRCRDRCEERGATRINLASGKETRVLDLLASISSELGLTKKVVASKRTRKGDPIRWRGENSKLCSLVSGWEPPELDPAVRACVRYWRSMAH